MIKNIIKEIEPECSEFDFYFDNDTFTKSAGEYGCTLFILCFDRGRIWGVNDSEYKHLKDQAEQLIDDISYNSDVVTDEILEENKLHKGTTAGSVAAWYDAADTRNIDTIAGFLQLKTGEKWLRKLIRGYSQGDWCYVLYNPRYYDNAEKYGEIFLGCAKEFSVTFLDDKGEEAGTVYGFIVADCEVKTDKEYKEIICKWEGLNPGETELHMIDYNSRRTIIQYDYKVV